MEIEHHFEMGGSKEIGLDLIVTNLSQTYSYDSSWHHLKKE